MILLESQFVEKEDYGTVVNNKIQVYVYKQKEIVIGQ